MSKTYFLINKQTNICDNAVVWDGDSSAWNPPNTHTLVERDIVEAVIWVPTSDALDFVLTPVLGQGDIGMRWDGVKLITTSEKPVIETTLTSVK